jgi:hypothetical protein
MVIGPTLQGVVLRRGYVMSRFMFTYRPGHAALLPSLFWRLDDYSLSERDHFTVCNATWLFSNLESGPACSNSTYAKGSLLKYTC